MYISECCLLILVGSYFSDTYPRFSSSCASCQKTAAIPLLSNELTCTRSCQHSSIIRVQYSIFDFHHCFWQLRNLSRLYLSAPPHSHIILILTFDRLYFSYKPIFHYCGSRSKEREHNDFFLILRNVIFHRIQFCIQSCLSLTFH